MYCVNSHILSFRTSLLDDRKIRCSLQCNWLARPCEPRYKQEQPTNRVKTTQPSRLVYPLHKNSEETSGSSSSSEIIRLHVVFLRKLRCCLTRFPLGCVRVCVSPVELAVMAKTDFAIELRVYTDEHLVAATSGRISRSEQDTEPLADYFVSWKEIRRRREGIYR